ncbi:DeoR/GlpR transcriptional regulator [Colidextribacter sp. OB.20]|uniref:DeoR/GlpR family DNA-binding transcription regulator n=1 Tax=Colidextribacter sp. OB.20 TaxID=2304568 RepID=UPI0013710102|nr:DeoR/GlpR family DNA-binding transcription regulator [Colidextribacter sp. OB.20]NBI09929.1 DeoR/GlpR transcriptional regulator [Colidextribacter sp. OB.20]
MLAEQRLRTILHQVSQRQTVSVADLCQLTGASEATIRRDLNGLARQGKLVKIHGGATSLEEEEFLAREPDLATKQRYAREKERIGRYAATLIGDDDVVYLDTGTTVLHMAEHLKGSNALFVTSSIEFAARLTEYSLHIYVLGGALKLGTVDIVGAEALDALRRYNFTKVFLGTSGISVSQGFTTPDPEAAALKFLAASRAQTVYMLADSSKFGRVTAATILPLEGARIITDKLPDRKYLDCTDIVAV